MRIRFLKTNSYDGITTGIVDGKATVSNFRFSFEYGQIIEVDEVITLEDNIVSILQNSNSFTVNKEDIEIIRENSVSFKSSDCGCKKK